MMRSTGMGPNMMKGLIQAPIFDFAWSSDANCVVREVAARVAGVRDRARPRSCRLLYSKTPRWRSHAHESGRRVFEPIRPCVSTFAVALASVSMTLFGRGVACRRPTVPPR